MKAISDKRVGFPLPRRLPNGSSRVNYLIGLSGKEGVKDDSRMGERELRQAWIQGIIDRRCKGNRAKFARSIDIESSSVYRMLLPEDDKNAKAITEKTIKVIVRKFPDDPPPNPFSTVSDTTGTQDASQLRQMELAVVALAQGLANYAPGAAGEISRVWEGLMKKHGWTAADVFPVQFSFALRHIQADSSIQPEHPSSFLDRKSHQRKAPK